MADIIKQVSLISGYVISDDSSQAGERATGNRLLVQPCLGLQSVGAREFQAQDLNVKARVGSLAWGNSLG